MPFYPSDEWDTVYALSDVHGDVGIVLTLFCDVMKVVERNLDPTSDPKTWRWVAPHRGRTSGSVLVPAYVRYCLW